MFVASARYPPLRLERSRMFVASARIPLPRLQRSRMFVASATYSSLRLQRGRMFAAPEDYSLVDRVDPPRPLDPRSIPTPAFPRAGAPVATPACPAQSQP